MSHFLAHYWQALSAPAGRVRERFTKHAGAGAAAVNDEHPEDGITRAEQLEHIAVYARAGYFNMGYTVDAFHLPADSPPH